jgi:hypothetical protein
MGYRRALMFLLPVRDREKVYIRWHVQMDGDSPCPEIVDTENAANDIPAQVVKDEDLPYRVSVFVEDGRGV